MKNKLFLFIVIIFVYGCNDFLDISPTNIISEESVMKDPVLIDAFLNKIYAGVRFQSGSSYSPDQALLGVMAGEQNIFAPWQTPFRSAFAIIDENGAPASLDYWPYDNIRSCNEIITMLANSKNIEASIIEQKTAEVRWLRAFMYFELVKRYGGVPLITKAQSINQPIDELYVPRSSEKEIYDFVASEMDALVNKLPESYNNDNYGRPTKWAAYALKSRAMLYAGSIAKYGKIQLDGLLGIPASQANDYYQKSYDAAMAIINSGKHPLYEGNTDPVANYGEIFIKDRNSEIIFAVVYNLKLLKTHSWNYVCMPDGFQTGWGSNNWMYLESFEHFEYNDGSSAVFDKSVLDGKHKFSLDEIILNKDPRFLASAFYPECPWQNKKVYFHSKTEGTIPQNSNWPEVAPKRNRVKTGLLIKKRVNEDIKLPIEYEDETDWIVFRTAEMYLNAAEAKFEMGDVDKATELINVIRKRAGMPDKVNISLDELRNERYVEMYLEEQRYWDIRRWRIAEKELNGKGFKGIVWTYYIDEDKYSMKIKDADFGKIRTFAERNYYLPFGLKRIASTKLIENPGYNKVE